MIYKLIIYLTYLQDKNWSFYFKYIFCNIIQCEK